MAVTRTDIRNRCKEFSAVGDSEVDLAIADALAQINASNWGTSTRADLATVYLTGHLLSVQNPSLATAAGAVQSETVGQVSRTYAVSASAPSSPYMQTKWGREYLRLLRVSVLPAAVV